MRIGTLKLSLGALFVCLAPFGPMSVAAQKPPPPEAQKPDPKPRSDTRVNPPARPELPEYPGYYGGRGTTEKAIAVAPNVNILISCVNQARVTVNGWQRDEIRVFIRNGTPVTFKVHEKDPKSGKPVWVVIGKQAAGSAAGSDCISGERIDIEVPVDAVLKSVGRETETRIDSVRRVEIKNVGGNVSLRNIPGGITATTFQGDVSVENSSGQISLDTSTGNILAFEVAPGGISDVFKAKTLNGAITLQRVEHRQIDASSITGSLVFNGKFLPGGIYGFKTQKGSIKLAIPAASSCRVSAWYGYGTMNSELPMKVETQDVTSAGKSVVVRFGEGAANVNLSTSNGQISIVKQ